MQKTCNFLREKKGKLEFTGKKLIQEIG